MSEYLIELKRYGVTLAEFRVGQVRFAEVCRLVQENCPADEGFVMHIYRQRSSRLPLSREGAGHA